MNTLHCVKKLCLGLCVWLGLWQAAWSLDASQLLPAEKAFVPQVAVSSDQVTVHFTIADGYYLYRNKISADTRPGHLLGTPEFTAGGHNKSDEFFGQQHVYYHSATLTLPYLKTAAGQPFTLHLSYQGCADAGICYPPVDTVLNINGDGIYQPAAAAPGKAFLQPDNHRPTPPALPVNTDSSRFKLSWQTLGANLLAFFIAGIGLSLTACMYPLLPIVSSMVVGGNTHSKRRAFTLSVVYVQGLALTYAAVGVVAGLSGALLTVWLQQRWVVLSAAIILALLALAMLGVYNLQLPSRWQSHFQSRSSRLRGGHLLSVWVMGMFSALIIGPCVAPPLAFALGYIGQTGDALLGALALYVLALGTGLPLVLVATLGGHVLPRAGAWMVGIKYAFGLLLLAAAVYLATPFLPYALVIAAYTLLLVIPAGLLLVKMHRLSGNQRRFSAILGSVLLGLGVYFAATSVQQQDTFLHRALTLSAPGQVHFGRTFFHPDDLNTAMRQAFNAQPKQPVIVDFYADWCASCKEMAAYTLSDAHVQRVLNPQRFLQIDVTANTPAQQALLKQFGLYGPPGLFVLHGDGRRSEPLLGYVSAERFLHWYQQQTAL